MNAGAVNAAESSTASVSGEAPVGIAWNEWFRKRITDSLLCPICMRVEVFEELCRGCGTDLSGDIGQEIWAASQRSAEALEARERLMLAAAASATAASSAPATEPAPATAASTTGGGVTDGPRSSAKPTREILSPTAPQPATAPQRTSATVQSMFALAGAGLVAVSAIVFTFFNPDLENRVVRSAIVGVVTLLFLGAAWWLARRGTRFSAEALGGLGVVFVGIDVWAFAQLGSSARESWLLAALATGLCALVALRLGALSGLRSWSLASLIAFSIVPAMLGYAGGGPLALALGHLGVVAVAAGLCEWSPRLRGARAEDRAQSAPRSFAIERGALAALQVLAALSAVPHMASALLGFDRSYAVGGLLLGFAAVAVFATRHGMRAFWSLVAGASCAAVLPAIAFGAYGLGSWQLAVVIGGATLGAMIVAVLVPRLRSVSHPEAAWAALSVPAVFAAPIGMYLCVTLVSARLTYGGVGTRGDSRIVWEAALPFLASGLIVAIGAALYARLTRSQLRPERRAEQLPVSSIPQARPARSIQPAQPVSSALRILEALCSVVSVVFVLLTVLAAAKFALFAGGVGAIAIESVTATFGLLIAIVATLVRRVSAREWLTVLAVTAVPFLLDVARVLEQRSGWTALTTASMFVLAIVLLLTRREALGGYLRVIAAAVLVPSLAVTVVCLGSLLLLGRAAPVVLSVIAALVALALSGSGLFADILARRDLPARIVGKARLALEFSALLTGAISVLLALVRVGGLGTACIVLLLIGIGSALMAALGGRRYGWWLAAASLTGSLWCVLGLREVGVLEAYLLPPTLGAALLAVVFAFRGSRQLGLYAVGLGAAIGPVLVMIGWGESGMLPRAIGLLVAAWALIGAVAATTRFAPRGPLVALAAPSLASAMLAGIAGAAYGARLGLAGEPFALCLLSSAVGSGAMLVAASGLRRAVPRLGRSRWLAVPGAIALAAGCWCAIDRNWADIWSMWGLMFIYLVVMVVVVRRQLSGRDPLIPAAVLFGTAFATSIVAWSPRDLRVDVFSLPLGIMLTVAGALALRRQLSQGDPRLGALAGEAWAVGSVTERGLRALARWPLGQRGSWPLLAPGVIVTVLASIVATFTDPQTWRAILVMVIALIAMLLGAWLRLAAPFVLGLIVLPIENVFVFAVQIGRGIDSMPWWITLATIGAVLLSIAVVTEQRAGEKQTLMARVRDLR